MAYAVIRTDDMHGTDNRADLVTAVYSAADVQNGSIVAVKTLSTTVRDVWTATVPTATEALVDLGVVASVETFYDEHVHALDNFVNAAGDEMRVYKLHNGDRFSVTEEALNGTGAVGKYVVTDGTMKMKVSDTSTNALGVIIAEEVSGRYTYFVIEVARA